MDKRKWLIVGLGLLVFFLSWNAFLYGVQNPSFPYFDEIRYLSAARQFFHGSINENWTHPPLAKWLISFGIRTIGDGPAGWRFMSTLFGAITIGLTFVLGLILFGSLVDALILSLLSFLNQVHYVQSRVATLDVFMMAFVMAGVSATALLWMRAPRYTLRAQLRLVLFTCVAFGLAIACKWFALAPAAACLPFALSSLHLSRRRKWITGAVFAFASVVFYLLASAFLLGGMQAPSYQPGLSTAAGEPHHYSPLDVLPMQFDIAKTQLQFQNPRHPYTSKWYTWPLMLRPMWYSYREQPLPDGNLVSSVFLVGNPLIFWFGFAAILVCVAWAVRRRSKAGALIAALYFSSFLVWAVLPRQVGFFYYYYPAAMFLAPALVEARRLLKVRNWIWVSFVVLSAGTFVFFYPILSGADYPASTIWSRLLFSSWSS